MRALRASLPFALLLLLVAARMPAAERPALVVVLSVDQMRADYLDRFEKWLAPDGFRRFLKRGARFPRARHRHASSVTCPGHAAIGTGRDPREHGVVANNWYEPALGRRVYCVEDRGAAWVGAPPVLPSTTALPASPNAISGDFVGDRLKEKYPDSRVVALSLKDRAAVPMGGRKADAAVWFVREFGRFVTSTYYPSRPSLLAFNDRVPEFLARHRTWSRWTFSPEKDFARVLFDPPELAKFKGTLEGTGDRFPYELPNARAVAESPFGDKLLVELARHAIRDYRLGRNSSGAPDLLFLGLSALDYYGHRFGPDSREVADGFLRLDRDLESFFRGLDAEVGVDRVLIFLTADHGVTTTPEVALQKARRARGGVRPDVAGRLHLGNVTPASPLAGLPADRLELELHLAQTFGYAVDPPAESGPQAAVLRFEDPIGIYLNRAVLAQRRLDLERVKVAARDWLRGRPGIRTAYTNTEIANGLPATEPLATAIQRGFRGDRSPDVAVFLKPGWIFRSEGGSSHGGPTDEDARVPLAAAGPGVVAGSYDVLVSPVSIAKTIAAVYGFDAGAADAEVLQPVLGRAEETRRKMAFP